MKTIDTKHLRDFIQRASPTPWLLATSNSWRRIVDANHAEVCTPCTQPDGHPDLWFAGGYEGANAQLLIEAVKALPALLDTIDTQADEIARLKSSAHGFIDEIARKSLQIEFLDRQNTGLRNQHSRDSRTLREYAQARDDLRKERDRLRETLRKALAQEQS